MTLHITADALARLATNPRATETRLIAQGFQSATRLVSVDVHPAHATGYRMTVHHVAACCSDTTPLATIGMPAVTPVVPSLALRRAPGDDPTWGSPLDARSVLSEWERDVVHAHSRTCEDFLLECVL